MIKNDTLSEQQQRTSQWFEALRDSICKAFEAIEAEGNSQEAGRFTFSPWQREGGGGGVMGLMRGDVFEKVGVNISTVHGQFDEKFAGEIPGTDESLDFFATGVSLVAHMKNPHVPAVHMNTRFIETGMSWFGGGADLTPLYPSAAETKQFHQALKAPCEAYKIGAYDEYKAWCDRYFYLEHRQEPRGIGGVFFDRLNSGDFEKDFNFVREIGESFRDVYSDIVRKKMAQEWTEEDRQALLKKRGRYVEFNLLQDRGTRFGLMTGGNVEAILMSLPPLAAW